MIIYIAGPMTGRPGNNYEAFHEVAALLREHGYTVTNPAENPEPECDNKWIGFMKMSQQAGGSSGCDLPAGRVAAQ